LVQKGGKLMSYGYSPKFSFIRTEREWRRWVIKNNLIPYYGNPKLEALWKNFEKNYDKPKKFPFAVNLKEEEHQGNILTFIPKEAIEKMCNMLNKFKKTFE
jgi:hypothetical protein